MLCPQSFDITQKALKFFFQLSWQLLLNGCLSAQSEGVSFQELFQPCSRSFETRLCLNGSEPFAFAVQANEDCASPGSTGKVPHLCPRCMIEDNLHQPCFSLCMAFLTGPLYRLLIKTFPFLLYVECQIDVSGKAKDVSVAMATFDYLFGIALEQCLLQYTDNPSQTLLWSELQFAASAMQIVVVCSTLGGRGCWLGRWRGCCFSFSRYGFSVLFLLLYSFGGLAGRISRFQGIFSGLSGCFRRICLGSLSLIRV